MKILVGSPSTGKTKKLLEMSAMNSIPVLCESSARVERLLEKARGYGYKIPVPVTYDTLTPDVKEVYIDELSVLVERMLNVRICAYTVNRNDETDVIDLG